MGSNNSSTKSKKIPCYDHAGRILNDFARLAIYTVLQVSAFCLAVGRDPTGLKIGVTNFETSNCSFFGDSDGSHPILRGEDSCFQDLSSLSCAFLGGLFGDGDKDTLVQQDFNSSEEALSAVEDGKAWGAVTVPSNFSTSILAGNPSPVSVRLDQTNQQIAYVLKRELARSAEDFSKCILKRSGRGQKVKMLELITHKFRI